MKLNKFILSQTNIIFLKIGINVRPFCIEFLEKLSYYYDVYIFTASNKFYAEAIVNFLDPNSEIIQGILSRNNCLKTKRENFIKDLSIIKNRNLKDIVLIDDLVHSFALQINNGIPIKRWKKNTKDRELKNLLPFLIKLSYEPDVRVILKDYFQLEKIAKMNFKTLMDD